MRTPAIIAITVAAILLSACGKVEVSDFDPRSFDTICLQGVSYWIRKDVSMYQGYGFMAVRYGVDGKIVLCD